MTKKKAEEKKEVVHTRLAKPIYLRKTILRSAIDATKALKDYKELKLIRTEKERVMGILDKKLQEISRRMYKLEHKDLPKLHDHEAKKMQKQVKQEAKSSIVMPREQDDVSKLKDELAAIERKLKNL